MGALLFARQFGLQFLAAVAQGADLGLPLLQALDKHANLGLQLTAQLAQGLNISAQALELQQMALGYFGAGTFPRLRRSQGILGPLRAIRHLPQLHLQLIPVRYRALQ